MRIFVKVRTGVKREKIEKLPSTELGAGDLHFVVSVKDRPISGKANIAVIKAIAGFLGVAQSRINIDSGITSRNKIFEII